MKFLRLIIATLCVGVLLTYVSEYHSVTAQDKEQTTQTSTTDGSKTPVGFVTGTTCTKSGVYQAENKYLRIVLFVAQGEEFPAFADGQKTTWYALTPGTKSTFSGVKVTADSN